MRFWGCKVGDGIVVDELNLFSLANNASSSTGSYTELDMSVEEEKPHTSGDVSGRSSTSSLANKASPKDQKKHQKGM